MSSGAAVGRERADVAVERERADAAVERERADAAVERERADVAVVGGGPAGLAAAAALRGAGVERVVVLDREPEMGGIPRHAGHQGFGVRDVRRVMPGPRYAARLTGLAAAGGAELRTETQVTGWADHDALELTSPRGRSELQARAVLLCTGCRERPRSARLIAGARPEGVMTTGTLQQLVYLRGESPGRQAVIVGAEHVSFSALITLAHGGARAVAMVTERPRHESFAAVRVGAALRFGTPLLTRTALIAIHGGRRVEAVELARLDTGEVLQLACDLVVLTADWIPEHELAVRAGAGLDPGTRGPAVDPSLRTSRTGLFAAGNLLHGAEPADVAALSGRHAAATIIRHLGGEAWPVPRVAIECSPPLRWIAPNIIAGSSPAERASRRRFLVRANDVVYEPVVEISQDRRALWRGRAGRIGPGRSGALTASWTAAVDPRGGPLLARVIRGRPGRAPRRRGGV
jgi:thioredoxin reductase